MTPRALPRIKAIYESQQQACQPELMAYFVRVDPAYTERAFHSQPWDMRAAPPPCTLQYFQRTPPLAMSPALEQYMAAYLMHSDVHVKTTAAHSLACSDRFGTTVSTASSSPCAGVVRWGFLPGCLRQSRLSSPGRPRAHC